MGFWGKLLGSEKAVNGVINGLDKAWFTDEEKGEIHLKFLKAYEPFKVAQRFLAMLFTVPFVLFSSIGIAFGNDEMITKSIDVFGTPTLVILSFYFAGGMIEGGIAKFKGL